MGDTAPLLDVENVSVRFGGVRALSDVSFQVQKGEIFSIIGPNGAGKTSMLNCISGRYKPTEGEIFFRGAGAPNDRSTTAPIWASAAPSRTSPCSAI